MATCLPGVNISADQPERRNTVAARISQRILVTLPSAAMASKYR
jgi:hypothetical protein